MTVTEAADGALDPHVRADPVYVVKAAMFKALGNPIRIRILEILTGGEHTVSQLQAELKLDSSGTSQHLTALRNQHLLQSRRAGTHVYYSLRDPRVSQLLAVAKQILTSALADSQRLLDDATRTDQAAPSDDAALSDDPTRFDDAAPSDDPTRFDDAAPSDTSDR